MASALACTADASGRWKLLPKDFCKGLPQELGRLPGPKDRLPKDVPKPADCFCPTNSLEQRFNSDPRGFDRQLPAGAHPKVPKLKSATRCAPGRSFVTYQCSRTPLVPVTAATSPKPALLGRRLGRWTWSHRSSSSSSGGACGGGASTIAFDCRKSRATQAVGLRRLSREPMVWRHRGR